MFHNHFTITCHTQFATTPLYNFLYYICIHLFSHRCFSGDAKNTAGCRDLRVDDLTGPTAAAAGPPDDNGTGSADLDDILTCEASVDFVTNNWFLGACRSDGVLLATYGACGC